MIGSKTSNIKSYQSRNFDGVDLAQMCLRGRKNDPAKALVNFTEFSSWRERFDIDTVSVLVEEEQLFRHAWKTFFTDDSCCFDKFGRLVIYCFHKKADLLSNSVYDFMRCLGLLLEETMSNQPTHRKEVREKIQINGYVLIYDMEGYNHTPYKTAAIVGNPGIGEKRKKTTNF